MRHLTYQKYTLPPNHQLNTDKLIFIAKLNWKKKKPINNYRRNHCVCVVTSLWYSLFESIATLCADMWRLSSGSRSVSPSRAQRLACSRSHLHLSSSSISQKTALLLEQFDEALSQVIEVKELDVEDLDDPLDLVLGAVSILQRGSQTLLSTLHPSLQIQVAHL